MLFTSIFGDTFWQHHTTKAPAAIQIPMMPMMMILRNLYYGDSKLMLMPAFFFLYTSIFLMFIHHELSNNKKATHINGKRTRTYVFSHEKKNQKQVEHWVRCRAHQERERERSFYHFISSTPSASFCFESSFLLPCCCSSDNSYYYIFFVDAAQPAIVKLIL